MAALRAAAAFLVISTGGSALAATSVTRFGITWTFSADRTVGVYANGDPWVLGPVTITDITPKSVVSGGRTINGSTINPESAMWPQHGFDSNMAEGNGSGFVASLNVGRPNGNDLSAGNPLTVPNGSSLISCISHPTLNNRPTITDVSILTVVASAPPAGSFRPPYAGDDKTHHWSKNDLNYGILQKLSLSGAPTPADMADRFERPWFELATEASGRYYHPANHQPEYGRDMAFIIGDAMLALHLNYSDAEKETLYVRLVQWGIDLYGCAKTGGLWADNGGLNAGRKGGLVLAAVALNDPNIRAFADAEAEFIFHEDRQTWYVTQSDVGRAVGSMPGCGITDGRQRDPYTSAHVGLAEWGEKHASTPCRDASNWGAYYRDVNYTAHLGEALAVRLTSGGMQAWNWPPFFDYMDRAWSISAAAMPAFPKAMWTAHRSAGTMPLVAPITITPPSSTGNSGSITPSASTSTTGVTFRWTTDGSVPDQADPTTAPTVTTTTTVRVGGFKSGMATAYASATYGFGSGACTSHSSFACDASDVYWFDSCAAREELKERCGGNGCVGGVCETSPGDGGFDGGLDASSDAGTDGGRGTPGGVEPEASGCGCRGATGPTSAMLWVALGLALLGARRHRAWVLQGPLDTTRTMHRQR